MLKNPFLSISLYALIFSCSPSDKGEKISSWNEILQHSATVEYVPTAIEIKELQKADSASIRGQDCNKYFKRVDSLRRIANEYFKSKLLIPALSDTAISKGNKAFLRAIDEYFNLSWDEKLAMPAFEKPLFPILKNAGSPLSIFSFAKWKCERKNGKISSCFNGDFESTFRRNRPSMSVPDTIFYSNQHNFQFFPEALDEIYDGERLMVYSNDSRSSATLTSFGVRVNVCESYHLYPLNFETSATGSDPLIGSPYELDLIYVNDPNTDFLIQSSYKTECFDCKTSVNSTTFAQLEGVTNLVFTFTDSYPSPRRSMYMNMEGNYIWLWNESLDLSGCSCD